VLSDISTDGNNYARHSELFAFKPEPHSEQVVPHSAGENIVVEFRYFKLSKHHYRQHYSYQPGVENTFFSKKPFGFY